jgi:hypothetical protein
MPPSTWLVNMHPQALAAKPRARRIAVLAVFDWLVDLYCTEVSPSVTFHASC